MAKLLTTSTDFGTLAGHLAGRYQKTIGNNTVLRDAGPGAIAVRLHGTDVVTVLADGSVTLDSGGYWTSTTKDRINAFARQLGVSVHSYDYEWRLTLRNGNTVAWRDGVTLDQSGEVIA